MKLRHKQRGAIGILVVAGLVALLAMAALALDSSHAMLNKTRLQNAVDAAALSGAKELDLTGKDVFLARAAAEAAFGANSSAFGNAEMGEAYADGTIQLEVQFSRTLDPFVPGTIPAEYVRVRARNFRLPAWFAPVIGISEKVVAASAVAGPSPTIDTACNIAPMMVCGDPDAGPPFWGYTPGEPDVIKESPPSKNQGERCVGPGNFQLIRLGDGQGGDVLRTNLAGGYDGCTSTDDIVITEPGNKVDPVARGLNTRFDEYGGAWNKDPNARTLYPPDVVTAPVPQPENRITSIKEDGAACGEDIILQNGQPITNGEDLAYNYDDYLEALRNSQYDVHPDMGGKYLRRELALPIGDCSTAISGSGPVPVLGFACYFLLQKVDHMGKTSDVYGQFIRECNAGGLPGPAPGDGPGLYIIQLYKDPDSPEA